MSAEAAFALAGSAAFLGCLAFAAFMVWMRAQTKPVNADAFFPELDGLRKSDQEMRTLLAELTDKVNSLSLAAGLRVKPKA